jgi:hypothetical protein
MRPGDIDENTTLGFTYITMTRICKKEYNLR